MADFHKMAEKDLQKLMKMRRTELIVNFVFINVCNSFNKEIKILICSQ